MDAWCELLVEYGEWVSLRQESSGKEEETQTQRPFLAALRVHEPHPAELGQQRASFRLMTRRFLVHRWQPIQIGR
jgi:hypothetical protein